VKRLVLNSARARWLLGIALCTLVAVAAALGNASGNLEVAGASAQAAVDFPRGSVVQNGVDSEQLQSLTARTLLLGELMSTPPVLAQIAHRAGIAPGSLSASTSYIQDIPEQMLGPDLEVRAIQIIKIRAPYQLDIQPDPNLPRLQIYARAPTPAGAEQLANAAVPGLLDYLRDDAISHHASPTYQVRVTQLGAARGGVMNSHVKVEIAGLTFLIGFGLCAALLLCAARIRAGWKLEARNRRSAESDRSDAIAAHAVRSLPSNVVRRENLGSWANHRRIVAGVADDWPHTTRVLPWMIAAFLVVLWLVPFDSIQLGGSSLPVDLKFDRIVLPFIMVTWVLALAAGRRAAPRVRLTWVHAGVLGFAALACLTLAVNAHYLDQTLQLDRGVKQLTLLGAYVIFFLMVASIVRRSEVSAFLRYTLVLAVIAAIGTIIEYRFQYNVFYDLAHKLLPGFQVGSAQSSSLDNLGRRLVEGPAEVPLEAVGMFTMALPIALVGITDATRWRQRILYGLAAAVLLAAAIATERKSGLIGPVAVILTLAYFKRRQMLRLVPLAVVLVAVVKVLAPGAIGGVTSQLKPSNLGVSTVSERVVRYDAIRPDVWLHLTIGQGFGVYSVRVLDNEFLDRLIEGGVLGLIAYVLMLLSIVFVAARAVRRREPPAATVGIVAASAAMGTLVLSATYDLMAFPHGPYVLLSLAGLLAVVVKSPRPTEQPRTRPIGSRRTRPTEPPRTRPTQPPRTKPQPAPEEAWSF
jgi:peptidoglycan/LPS O-acetylase OafA/YrhL